MGCNNNSRQDCGCGCDRREYDCRNTRQVIKHCDVVTHKHDIIHEYDVVHKHDYHYYDVVRVREENKHHDHRKHKPNYCEDDNCDDVGIETVGGEDCGCDCN